MAAGEVHDHAAAALQRLVEALAQRGCRVDVVLSLYDHDDHVVGRFVEDDRVRVHCGTQSTQSGSTPVTSGRMADRLDRYRAKRDFATTPEPGGEAPAAEAAARDRFVVHEHHARRLHWDLRLERDGVLVSWAVPKGIPPDPAREPPGRPHRGPPARVHRLPRRHPGRPVRRRAR